MNYIHQSGPYVRDILSAAYVAALIAVASAVIGWQQLSYAKKRDAALDLRNTWEKIHKAMMEFRFRRELLNQPIDPLDLNNQLALAERAFFALHNLKGEVTRAPQSAFTTELWAFLEQNFMAAQWRAPQFAERFDQFAHRAAVNARGETP